MALAAFMIFAPAALADAVSTTDDPGYVFGTAPDTYTAQACVNGNGVNCNIYLDKRDAWISGLPTALPDGNYFFAVLDPGAQRNANDGAPGNLSSSNDAWTNREFSISGGTISYSGDGGSAPAHAFDSNKLNLAPYDDTSNPGGLYTLAVCVVPGTVSGSNPPGVSARDCSFDAFEVNSSAAPPGCQDTGTCPPVTVNSVITGNKWLDPNGDGEFEPTEAGLQSWKIDVTDITSGTPGTTVTETTDSFGNWSFTTPDITVGSGSRIYQVCEELQTGWTQTGPDTIDVATANGTATGAVSATLDTSTPGSNCYDVTVPDTAVGTIGSVDFFNQPTGTISGEKYFDANRSGQLDGTPTESGISGWEIQIAGTSGLTSGFTRTVNTGSDGTFSVSGLVPGTYTVSEVLPTNLCGMSLTVNCWVQTGNTVSQLGAVTPNDASASLNTDKTYSVTVSSTAPTTASGLNFGNVCMVHDTGGPTLGFWSNNNGQAILSHHWDDVSTLIDSTLYLVGGTKSVAWSRLNVSTTFATGYATLRSWLLNASSTNASYMLSAQLLTTALDRLYGGMSNYLVLNPVGGGYVTIDSLVTLVSGFIANNPYTVQTGTSRSNAVAYQTLFNALNNSQATVTGISGSSCPAPTFSS